MALFPRVDASCPVVRQDRFGRFQVLTEHGACWRADAPSLRQVHEARARELRREAVDLALRGLAACARRAVRACLRVRPEPALPALFTIQRRP